VIAFTLLISFLLNVVSHHNLLIGVLNTFLLFLCINFYVAYSNNKNLSFFKLRDKDSYFFILLGAMPLFSKKNDIVILLLAIGFIVLILFYLKNKSKILLSITAIYGFFIGLYGSGLINFPFYFQDKLLVFNDNWINSYILQMRIESQYMPSILRLLVYNHSVIVYVMLSKVTGLFSLKNFHDNFLLANIYPFLSGFCLDMKKWDRSKNYWVFLVLTVSFSMVLSRSMDRISATIFIFLSPFFVYYISDGLSRISKKIYLLLFIFSYFLVLDF